jgi:hypothetical protein
MRIVANGDTALGRQTAINAAMTQYAQNDFGHVNSV